MYMKCRIGTMFGILLFIKLASSSPCWFRIGRPVVHWVFACVLLLHFPESAPYKASKTEIQIIIPPKQE